MSPAEAAPYEGLGELRVEHSRLLDRLDSLQGDDAGAEAEARALREMGVEVDAFLRRGSATGVFLDEIAERTAAQVLLDYWAVGLTRAAGMAPPSRLVRFDSAQLPQLDDASCPYVGLESFRGESFRFFFGREADTATLLRQVAEVSLVIVVGASGSGKSSLVLGGALPALAAEASRRMLPTLVPGDAPLLHLAQAVAAAVPGTDAPALAALLRSDASSLPRALAVTGAAPVVLTIDQFEEVFTLADVAEREALAAALAALMRADANHRVLLTMREDFRSRLVELSALAPWRDKAWYSMRPMGYDELRAAVERPAAAVNLRVHAEVVDDLVKRVLGQPAALPLLQFTLRALWMRRDRNRITKEVYREVGDPLTALQTSADDFFDAQLPQTQGEIKRVLLALVRVDQLLEAYRQPVRLQVLTGARKANTLDVLELLAKGDYIRITGDLRAGDAVVEVKHEALIRNWARYVDWIDEKRISRRQRLALAQTAQRWTEAGRPEEALLTGWQLQEASKLGDELTPLEREFVAASQEAVDRELKRLEALLAREQQAREASERLLLLEQKAREDGEQVLQREQQARELSDQLFRRERSLRHWTLGVTTVLVALAGFVGSGLMMKNRTLQKESETLAVQKAEAEKREQRLQADNADLKRESDATAAELAAVRADRLRLEEERGELLASQLQKTLGVQAAAAAGRQPGTLYIQISSEVQRERADDLALKLQKAGLKVPGIERVRVPISSTQVRYFHLDDERDAKAIVNLLGSVMGIRGAALQYVPGYARVPRQQFELWFAADALVDAPAASRRGATPAPAMAEASKPAAPQTQARPASAPAAAQPQAPMTTNTTTSQAVPRPANAGAAAVTAPPPSNTTAAATAPVPVPQSQATPPTAAVSPAASAARQPSAPLPAPANAYSATERARLLVYRLDNRRAAKHMDEARDRHPFSWAWAKSRAQDMNIRTALGMAVLFDTAAAHGPVQASTMRARRAPSAGDLASEKAWLLDFLARRQALADTAAWPDREPARLAELRRLIEAGEWDLARELPASR